MNFISFQPFKICKDCYMKLLCYKKNSGNNQDIQSSCHFERESDSFLMNYAILHNIDNINKQRIWSLELLKPDHASYRFTILLPAFGTSRNPTRQSPKGVQAQEDINRAGFFQFLLDSKGRPKVDKCIMIFKTVFLFQVLQTSAHPILDTQRIFDSEIFLLFISLRVIFIKM